MTTDIFIKTYPKDACWLVYCLKSIQKFVTGFRDVIVAMPNDMDFPLTQEKIVRLPGPESYLYQQVAKLNADAHSDADCILHVDSDMIFKRHVSPKDFITGGKPVWLIRSFKSPQDQEYKAWFHVMAKCLRRAPVYEYMCKSTVIIPRQAYGLFREFIQTMHGIPMDAYVMNQPANEFSEYNCLGGFLHANHPDLCHWRNIDSEGIPEQWDFQSWSYGGITPEIRAKIETILS